MTTTIAAGNMGAATMMAPAAADATMMAPASDATQMAPVAGDATQMAPEKRGTAVSQFAASLFLVEDRKYSSFKKYGAKSESRIFFVRSPITQAFSLN